MANAVPQLPAPMIEIFSCILKPLSKTIIIANST
jgi:hypothetical protein